MFEISIVNGIVVDGSGGRPYAADIGISQGRIGFIGKTAPPARKVIDAAGRHVAPGFIDMHSHSDFSLLANPRLESKIRQGITTEVIGNCGDSAAPLLRDQLGLVDERNPVAGYGIRRDWLSMADYLARVRRQGTALNIVALVGHNTVRAAVMGYAGRAAGHTEMDHMQTLVARCMNEGAKGLSSGLIYPPGCYAHQDELVALARVVAERGGFYAIHMRSEGERLVESVAETITIGEQAGVPMQISHHKATGENNWGKVNDTLALIDAANERGLDVSADQYPYTASSTDLTSMLPYWMLEGSVADVLGRLQNPTIRQRLKNEIRLRPGYFANTWISQCKGQAAYEGMNLESLGTENKKEPLDAVLDLLIQEETYVKIVSFSMSEKDIHTVMRHPRVMFGTDGEALASDGPMRKGKPHPRAYGTFPRILGKYVREEKVLPLASAIHKMTALPARRLGLYDRGKIAEGYRADITVFDSGVIRDTATFTDPHQYPVGIDAVLVNGQCVVSAGTCTGCLPGMVL